MNLLNKLDFNVDNKWSIVKENFYELHSKDMKDLLELDNRVLGVVIICVLLVLAGFSASSFIIAQEIVSEQQKDEVDINTTNNISYNLDQSYKGADVKINNFEKDTAYIKIMVGAVKYKEINEPKDELHLSLSRGTEVKLIEVKEDGTEKEIHTFIMVKTVNGASFA